MTRPFTLGAVAAAILLSGCVSVFPKATPVQLYQLGFASGSAPAQAAPHRADILLAGLSLPQAASGDRMLTINGPEVAYISSARWVTPAAVLVREALERAYAANGVTLVDRRFAAGQKLTLQVDIQTFAADYSGLGGGAPTVRIEGTARLVRASDRSVLSERRFAQRQRASDNRVSAIVFAYDSALDGAVSDLVGWTASLTQGSTITR